MNNNNYDVVLDVLGEKIDSLKMEVRWLKSENDRLKNELAYAKKELAAVLMDKLESEKEGTNHA